MPARPLSDINAHDILLAMRNGIGQELPAREEPSLAQIYGEFARIEKAEREAASTISLLALTQRVSLAMELPPPASVVVPPPLNETPILALPKPVASVAAALIIEEIPVPLDKAKAGETPAKARREIAMPTANDFPL